MVTSTFPKEYVLKYRFIVELIPVSIMIENATKISKRLDCENLQKQHFYRKSQVSLNIQKHHTFWCRSLETKTFIVFLH